MNFINELISQVYEDGLSKPKVFGVYPGRFQPPGPHHYQTFQWMESKFGKGNVFVATSDKVELPNSPLNFADKKAIWMKYGVSENRVVQVRSPYQSSEVLDSLPEGSAVVFGFGQKDAERFNAGGLKKDGTPSYLQFYEKNKDNLKDFTQNSYLIILPHVSAKVDGKELSGTQIREMLKTDPSEEMFTKIFGWYDSVIHANLLKKLGGASLNEGGNIFGDVSMVKKENLDLTIKSVLKQNGMETIPYSKIGNTDKPLLGDIDIAIDTQDMFEFLGLEPTSTKDELFDAIAAKLPSSKATKGLMQFHLKGTAPNQKFINSSGQEENKVATVQVDVMLGVRKWREKFFSGAKDSQYKAKFRNMFLSEILSKVIEDAGPEGVKQKYLLSPAEGFFLQKFVMDAKGKRKELSRELKSTDMDFVAEFIFGEGKKFEDINTFEKVYKLFLSDSFKFPEFRREIVTAYKQNMALSKKAEPNLLHPKVVEEKMSIQRFSGPNEMSDAEFLKFLQKIQPLVKNGKMDLSVGDTASVTEKLDGSPCEWGVNASNRFFMESANSGEITIENAEKFNNPFTVHFYATLKFLNTYQPFQKRLQLAKQKHGAFKVASEMFPVLTHKGDALGDIVFCSTKYNREKLGNKGSFVCFSATDETGDDQKSAAILSIIESVQDPEWKVYNINKHGSLSREGLVFNVTGIQDLISDPVKLQNAITLLKGRKESPEKDALKKVILKVRQEMQGVLNQYAERINTFLSSDSSRKYPVEGVVLKIHLPDEDVFIKGTSEVFHKIAEKTWGTRKAVGNAEKVLDGDFLTTVLGLSTSHATTINKVAAAAQQKYGSDDDKAMNKVALHVYEQLKDANVDVSESSIKQRAATAIKAATSEVNAITSKWQQVKKTGEVDPDTIDKTENQLKFVTERLNAIKSAVSNPQYKGVEYVVYLLRLFIDKRIQKSVDNT